MCIFTNTCTLQDRVTLYVTVLGYLLHFLPLADTEKDEAPEKLSETGPPSSG